jgi:carboxymethylenebutenolidase
MRLHTEHAPDHRHGTAEVASDPMAETVEFPSNGGEATGYLALPDTTPAPGVLVIQEWWGLVPQLTRVCDRLAAQGFVALAPDLYHGEIATHQEMDKAAELMNALPADRAARDMNGAVQLLLDHDAVAGSSVGVIGFCMGGNLALILAAQQGDRIGAVVPFYGAPIFGNAPDWAGLTAPVEGHFGEADGFFDPAKCHELEQELKSLGKDVTFHWYDGLGHAFANEEDPLGNYDEGAARTAFERAIAFLHAKLG